VNSVCESFITKGYLIIKGIPNNARQRKEGCRKRWKGLLHVLSYPQDGFRLDVAAILLYKHN